MNSHASVHRWIVPVLLAAVVGRAQDIIPPTAPGYIGIEDRGNTSLRVEWSPGSDNVGVTGYELFQNGVSLGVSTAMTRTLTGLSPLTVYRYTARARDAAGNWSSTSYETATRTYQQQIFYGTATVSSYWDYDEEGNWVQYFNDETFVYNVPADGILGSILTGASVSCNAGGFGTVSAGTASTWISPAQEGVVELSVYWKPPVAAPVASISAIPSSGRAPLMVTFTSTSTTVNGLGYTNWNFAGQPYADAYGYGQPQVRTYYGGSFDAPQYVRMDMADVDGNSGSAEKWIMVYPEEARTISVQGGMVDKQYALPGAAVLLTANTAPVGQLFGGWVIVSGDGTITTPGATTSSFIVGNNDVIVRAQFMALPAVPVATAATNVTNSGFTANWNAAAGASAYSFDFCGDSTFATAQTLNLANVTGVPILNVRAGITFYYRVRSSNAVGTSANSNVVAVYVPPVTPTITRQPTSVQTRIGSDASFTVIATGIPPPTYQWYKGAETIAGATTSTLTFRNAQLTDDGTITVRVTNAGGDILSNAVTLDVSDIAIVTPPISQVVNFGKPVSLSVGATGSGTLTYQWLLNNVALPGATTTSVAIASAQAADAGTYAVVVSDPTGSVTSSAVLDVRSAQSINFLPIADHQYGGPAFPVNASASSGLPVSFSVVSGPAAVSGNMVTLTGVGTVVLRAMQAGDAQYTPAPTVDQAFKSLAPPGFAVLTVVGGTASAVGGYAGTNVTVTATIPSGKYFAGWAVKTGWGTFGDVSNPTNSWFTLGSGDTTVQAMFIDSPPTYSVGWNEINLPTIVTAGNQTDSTAWIRYGGVVTNTGTGAWSPQFPIQVCDSSGNPVCWGGISSAGGVLPGAKTQVYFTQMPPPTAGTYRYSYSIGPPPYSLANAWSTIYKDVTVQAVGSGSRPQITSDATNGTVSVPYSTQLASTGSPTTWSVTGTLPPGISLSSTGLLTGTPSQPGVYAATIGAINSTGRTFRDALFTIYPDGNYTISIMDGSANTSTVTVGGNVTLTANSAPAGKYFNGWTLVGGQAKLTDPLLPTTSMNVWGPGNVTVQATFQTGAPLRVVDGWRTPLGGVSGDAVTIIGNGEQANTMFKEWTTIGPGGIVASRELTTAFQMAASGATVQANYKPGNRLLVGSGLRTWEDGGINGTRIDVLGSPTSTNDEYVGNVVSGPGVMLGSKFLMGKGPAIVAPAFWPKSAGKPIYTYIQPPPTVEYGYPLNLTVSSIDEHGAITEQRLDYTTDGGNTWVLGTIADKTRWSIADGGADHSHPYPNVWQFTPQLTFPSAGVIYLRAVGIEDGYMQSTYFCLPAIVLNHHDVPRAVVTSPSVINATVNRPVTEEVVATNTDEFTVYALSGQLPEGMSFNGALHVITGTPTKAGTATVTLTVYNGNSTPGTAAIEINVIQGASIAHPGVPTAATLVAGANGFTAHWLPVEGAVGYEIEVSTTADFNTYVTPYHSFDVGNVTTYTVTGLEAGKSYYFRYRAYNQGGESESTDPGQQVAGDSSGQTGGGTSETSTLTLEIYRP